MLTAGPPLRDRPSIVTTPLQGVAVSRPRLGQATDSRATHAPTRRPPFVMLPTSLVYDTTVSGDARTLWAILDDLAREAVAAPAFVAQLAAVMDCSERTIRRLRGELEAAGWLTVHGDGGGRSTPPIWQPLGRARPVHTPVGNPVENGPLTRSDLTGIADGNPARSDRVSGPALYPRARQESEPRSVIIRAQAADAARPPCGRCDPSSRQVTVVDAGGREVQARCPTCHPLRPRF
jgi:hypothetical protein